MIIYIDDKLYDRDGLLKEDRAKLREEYGKDYLYYCGCNHKAAYKLSANLRFYPASRNEVHESECSESQLYRRKNEIMKALKEDKKGCIVANIVGKNDCGDCKEYLEAERRMHDTTVNRTTFSAYCSYLLTRAYTKRKFAREKLPINKYVYGMMMSTTMKVGKHKFTKIGSDEFPYKIYYGFIKKIRKTDKNDAVDLLLEDSAYPIKVAKNTLINAREQFKRTYKTTGAESNIMCFIKRKKGKHNILNSYINETEIVLLPVSNGCLPCDSFYEQQVYSQIEELEKEHNFIFYKPYEYGYGAYGGKYLEDGIITKAGAKRKIVIEIFGMSHEKYLETKQEKINMINSNPNYELFSVDFANKEQFDEEKLIDMINKL